MKKNYQIAEVLEMCGVKEDFVLRLEREELIQPIRRGGEKLYPIEQVDRIRVAHVLFRDMGVNLAGIDVALHMRAQMIAMQRQYDRLIRSVREALRREG